MKIKTKTVYESSNVFMEAMNSGKIKVGDELITRDIQGKAKYVVADLNLKAKAGWDNTTIFNIAYMVRKYALKEPKPMKDDDFDLLKWLNKEYLDSIPDEVKGYMVPQESRQIIDLPREIEVFGKNEYGVKEEGKQWPYFKNTKNRICTTKKDDEYSHWWWLGTPYRASAANFCLCNYNGDADYLRASYAHVYVRPRFILAQRNQ